MGDQLRCLKVYCPSIPDASTPLQETEVGRLLLQNISQSLARVSDGKVHFDLLESCSLSHDRTCYRMQLRRNSRLSSGKPIDSGVVIDWLKKISNSEIHFGLKNIIADIRSVSRHRFEVVTKTPRYDLIKRAKGWLNRSIRS